MPGLSACPDHPAPPLGPALLAEGLGTFVLTLMTVAAAALAQGHLLPDLVAHALTPALVILTMIFTLGDLSGAHFNPVVTLAFALRGAFPWGRVLPYVGAQFAASAAAAALLRTVTPLPHPTERVLAAGATLLEVGATFFLLTVILGVAHRNQTLKVSAGLIVGTAVGLDHLLTNPLSAVAMNPAKSFGPALLRADLAGSWPHLLGPLAGALLALAFTRLTRDPANAQECEAAQGRDRFQ
ncbi:MIP/aquaporin family protein [Deinococcus multiflagellatus]|uniref:MIP/aquaporin family protein n=1 Tax=Deinococcus multiflagellatus TaxID=1656887 RepID=A0ABW1ZH20_9DEIO|nr:aquaporin [Deinococcus multiflagellatus]MBZ9711783.1 aquaporin [Deinococcus multiflagellatus]